MIQFFRDFAQNIVGHSVDGVSDGVIIALGIVAIWLIIVSIFALFVQIYLAISYVKYNRKKNSIGLTGEKIARKMLDDAGLENIAVKASGSMLFGNSYSHYFKKVRLRRLTWKKDSVASLAMASQKSCLAMLDKENDPDMRTRVRLTPLIYLGPIAFIPLVIIGVLLDAVIINNGSATFTIALTIIGLLFYVLSFVMSLKTLKTEVKAQEKAYEILSERKMATAEELEMLKKLFKLYNIEYVNDMIIALLELIYRILILITNLQSNSSI